MGARKHHKFIIGKMRREILQQILSGAKPSCLAGQYGVSTRTIRRIIEDGDPEINDLKCKKGTIKYKEVEKMVLDEFERLRAIGIPMNGPRLKLIALKKRDELLNSDNYSAKVKLMYSTATFGDSWFEKFKKRHQIYNRRLNGERAKITNESLLEMNNVRAVIRCLNLPLNRIYNWDETALFYKGIPKYTLVKKGDSGAGGSEDKSRITLLISTNADGSDRQTWVIGKSKTPRGTNAAFWESHGLTYFSNQKAWMTKSLFHEILIDFDKKQSSLCVVIMDNFSGHECAGLDLKYVIPVFLPPNTTSVTQPLDAGIISGFKVIYKSKLMDFVVNNHMNGGFHINQITLAKCAPWIKVAEVEIKSISIQKCFARALGMDEFLPAVECTGEGSEHFKTLQQNISKFLGVQICQEDVATHVNSEDNLFEDLKVENTDHISIQDSKKMLQHANELKLYLSNTNASPIHVANMDNIINIITGHINFE
jgi:DDE superfamily endonuclease/Tc5 transposase DNA-binding domain